MAFVRYHVFGSKRGDPSTGKNRLPCGFRGRANLLQDLPPAQALDVERRQHKANTEVDVAETSNVDQFLK